MRARAWHLVAIGALAPLPIFVNWGCQGTCQATSDCPDTDYCSIATGACLGPRALGFCKPKPESCPQVISQVCGCDGQTFINACEAARAGVPIASDPPCQVACGGPSATTCPEGSFCQYADSVCGAGMAYGQCQTKPVTCDPTSKKVCGCDGKTYTNECLAQQASVSIAVRASCEAADGGGGGGGGGGSGGGDGGTLMDIKLLITEVRTQGPMGDMFGDEFVEIYNPNDFDVTVDNTWILRYRNAQGGCAQSEEIRFQGKGDVLGAHRHLLLVGMEYAQSPLGDRPLINNSKDFSLGDAGNLYLFRNNKVVDAVCWYFSQTSFDDVTGCMTAMPYVCEGTPVSNLPHCGTTNPICSADASFRRKTDMNGVLIDTDDNEMDFESAAPSTPENLASPPTP